MGAPAPQWLLPAYVRSVSALGATASREEIETAGRDLLERWSSPDRHFHGVTHLVNVLQRVDTLAQETHNPEMVRVAAWYHGAKFDSKMLRHYKRAAGEHKPESAALARHELMRLGVSEKVAQRVHDLIMGLTRHDADPSDVDSLALCDADLGTLASEPQRFKEYRKKVREEFDHIPVRDYVEARIAIVTKLLARRKIYLSPLAASWEDAARQNLQAELVKLRALLDSLPPREAGDESIEPADLNPPLPPRAQAAPTAADGQDALAPLRDSKATTSRFSKDESYSAADTATFPALRAGAARSAASPATPPPAAPSRTPITHAQSPRTASPAPAGAEDDGDDLPCECIGLPYEERAARTRPVPTEDRPTSGIERVPENATAIPRRVSIMDQVERHESAPRPSSTVPSSTAPSSTGRDEEQQSTGTLFRPVEQ